MWLGSDECIFGKNQLGNLLMEFHERLFHFGQLCDSCGLRYDELKAVRGWRSVTALAEDVAEMDDAHYRAIHDLEPRLDHGTLLIL